MPSSRVSSGYRDGACISCIAGGLLTAEPAGKPPQSGWGGSNKELVPKQSPRFLYPPFALPSLPRAFLPALRSGLGAGGHDLESQLCPGRSAGLSPLRFLSGASSASTLFSRWGGSMLEAGTPEAHPHSCSGTAGSGRRGVLGSPGGKRPTGIRRASCVGRVGPGDGAESTRALQRAAC